MKFKTYRAVELARTGTFFAMTGKVTFTEQDFDDMATAHAALAGKVDPPLKLGHNDGQRLLKADGLPAAGWVQKVRRVGDRLVADYIDVPPAIAALIDQNKLRKRSIEAIRNGEFGGKRWPIVLTAVALLGEDLPAVDSLSDVADLYAASHDMEAHSRIVREVDADAAAELIAASVGDDLDELVADLESVFNRAKSRVNVRGASSIEAIRRAAIEGLRREVAASIGEGDDMDRAKIIELLGLADTATDEEITAALTAAKAARGDQDNKSEDADKSDEKLARMLKAALDPIVKEIGEIKATGIATASAAATKEATELVEGAIKARRFVPAVRDELIKLATDSPESARKLIDGTPDGTAVAVVERGTSATAPDLGAFEPTAEELKLAAQLGNTREALITQKMRDAGHSSEEIRTALGKSEDKSEDKNKDKAGA